MKRTFCDICGEEILISSSIYDLSNIKSDISEVCVMCKVTLQELITRKQTTGSWNNGK